MEKVITTLHKLIFQQLKKKVFNDQNSLLDSLKNKLTIIIDIFFYYEY